MDIIMIIGILVVGAFFLLGVVLIAFFAYRAWKKSKNKTSDEMLSQFGGSLMAKKKEVEDIMSEMDVVSDKEIEEEDEEPVQQPQKRQQPAQPEVIKRITVGMSNGKVYHAILTGESASFIHAMTEQTPNMVFGKAQIVVMTIKDEPVKKAAAPQPSIEDIVL